MGLKILVLDDEPMMVRALRTHLEMDGHEVLSATSALDAIAIVRAAPLLQLALLDWELGTSLTGLDVGKHLMRRGVPVFILSGHSKEEIRGTWLDPLAGVLEFFEKPIEWAELKADIDRVERSLHDTDPGVKD
jgi:DNA-binding response OmpR family regulator